MVDIEQQQQQQNQTLRRNWRIWDIEREEGGNTGGEDRAQCDGKNIVKRTDNYRYSWLQTPHVFPPQKKCFTDLPL